MAAWDVPARLWSVARKVEELFELQGKTLSALEVIGDRLRALEDRMVHLEADQGKLLTAAGSAATVAASGIASSIISDVVTRVTKLEIRQDEVQDRLSGPK